MRHTEVEVGVTREDVTEVVDFEVDPEVLAVRICGTVNVIESVVTADHFTRSVRDIRSRIGTHRLTLRVECVMVIVIDFVAVAVERVHVLMAALDAEEVDGVGIAVSCFHHHFGAAVFFHAFVFVDPKVSAVCHFDHFGIVEVDRVTDFVDGTRVRNLLFLAVDLNRVFGNGRTFPVDNIAGARSVGRITKGGHKVKSVCGQGNAQGIRTCVTRSGAVPQ